MDDGAREMILVKRELLERILRDKLVEGAVELKQQLQPAGIDLTLAKVLEFASAGALDFDDSERVLSGASELAFDERGWVALRQGAYKIQFNELVRVPSDLCAVTFARSSLARCGGDLYNGFWDPGYVGRGESVLLIHNPKGLRLKKNARVAQLVFFRLGEEARETYSGMHFGENTG